jgi:hypothetical protein
MNDLRDITANITGLEILDNAELDITWNYLNNLASSREMLLFVLAKISSIPMIDYFAETEPGSNKKVFEEFNLNLENANEIQNLNIELLKIQKRLQLYCTEMYTILSVCGKSIDDAIDNIDEEKDQEIVNTFMNTVQAFLEKNNYIQTGGTRPDIFKTILKVFMLLLLFIPVQSTEIESQASRQIQVADDTNDSYNPDNSMIISTNYADYVNELETMEYKQKSVDISKTIAVYDNTIKTKYDGAFGQLMQLFTDADPSAKEIISTTVNDINKQLKDFSTDVEKNCLDLMKQSYDKGIFASWKSLDDIETTREKMIKTQQLIEEQNSKSMTDIAGSAIAHAVSGTYFSSVSFLLQAGESLVGLMSSTNEKVSEIENEIEKVIEKETSLESYPKITAEQRRFYEENDYKHSKVFCSYGYYLELGLDDTNNTLDIYGSKIDYKQIVKLIQILDENLKMRMLTLAADSEGEEVSESTKMELQIIISTSQRLNILKEITDKLSDIIDFSFKSNIMKLQGVKPSKDTISHVKEYFDGQLNDLNLLLMKINELFPKQREEIEEKKKHAESQMELKILEQERLDLESISEDEIRRRASARYEAETASKLNATVSIFKSWNSIIGTYINLGGTLAQTTVAGVSREATKTAFQIPKEFILNGFKETNEVFWETITTPIGFMVWSFPLFMFATTIGSTLGLIKTVVWGGSKFILIQLGRFVSVFRIFKTPFGYVLRLVKVFIIESANTLTNTAIAAKDIISNTAVAAKNRLMNKFRRTQTVDEDGDMVVFDRDTGAPIRDQNEMVVFDRDTGAPMTGQNEMVVFDRDTGAPLRDQNEMVVFDRDAGVPLRDQNEMIVPKNQSRIPFSSFFNPQKTYEPTGLQPTKPFFPTIRSRATIEEVKDITFNNPPIKFSSSPSEHFDQDTRADAEALLRLRRPPQNRGNRDLEDITSQMASARIGGKLRNKNTRRRNKKNKHTKRYNKHNKHKKTKNRIKKHKKTQIKT